MSINTKQFPLNKAVYERRFFLRVKLVTLSGDGTNLTETRYTPDQKLTAETMTDALEEAYALYDPENPENRWLSFEVYEEEVITTRRLIYSGVKSARQVANMQEEFRVHSPANIPVEATRNSLFTRVRKNKS